jgi:CRISPR/Cas system-associated exonuclease Cas4 (RecB family)
LNSASDHFHTAIRGAGGTWPTAPGFWSYSSLGNAEECPRRWMLSRADYGDLWDGPGYPPRPTLAALAGSVVHRCLELLLTTFQAQGCASVTDPSAVEAIRRIGGYGKLVGSVITEELAILQGNPRATELKATLERQLVKQVPHIRERVQLAISRAQLMADQHDPGIRSDAATRTGITPGSHAEVELRADELRLLGRADLITVSETGCTITDYKTGAPSDHHAEQLRLYGLLWRRDREINPDQIPIERLVVSYATHDEVVDVPSDAELERLADQISVRIAATEEQLALRPPPANPDSEVCEFCDVRHLCDDYWVTVCSTLGAEPAVSSGAFVDCEGEVIRQNGPRSWVLKLEGEPDSALLRTPTERPGFAVGDFVRLLGVAAKTVQEEGISQCVLTMTSFSESFQVDRV